MPGFEKVHISASKPPPRSDRGLLLRTVLNVGEFVVRFSGIIVVAFALVFGAFYLNLAIFGCWFCEGVFVEEQASDQTLTTKSSEMADSKQPGTVAPSEETSDATPTGPMAIVPALPPIDGPRPIPAVLSPGWTLSIGPDCTTLSRPGADDVTALWLEDTARSTASSRVGL